MYGRGVRFQNKGNEHAPRPDCVDWSLSRAATLDNRGKMDIMLVSRALLASNPIERRGGPRFPLGIVALSLHVTPLCSENAPLDCQSSDSKYASAG